MKFIWIGLLALMSANSYAQIPPGMDGAQMQEMMRQMQGFQACIEKIDRSELKAFEQKSHQASTEIEALCRAGERNQAQKRALAFGMEVAGNAGMQQIKVCSQQFQSLIQQSQFYGLQEEAGESDRHVCDD